MNNRLLLYPSYATGSMNVSEFARICKLSRKSIYKDMKIVEGQD